MHMTTPGTFQDAKAHFFIYIERIGTSDLLHELRTSHIAPHPDVERIASITATTKRRPHSRCTARRTSW